MEDLLDSAGLDGHDAYGVGDDVVQLAGYASPLLGDHGLFALGLAALELLGAQRPSPATRPAPCPTWRSWR
jgi:hypothetical protein